MKTISFLVLFLALFTFGCNRGKDKANANERKEVMKESTESNIILPILLIELDKLNKANEAIKQGRRFDYKVIVVYFSQESDDCYVTLSTTHFYDSQLSKGYTIINDKMIVFYNPDHCCNNGLVDAGKLIKDKPAQFPDENSDIAQTDYEPHGRIFKIYNKTRLELIYSGYL